MLELTKFGMKISGKEYYGVKFGVKGVLSKFEIFGSNRRQYKRDGRMSAYGLQ